MRLIARRVVLAMLVLAVAGVIACDGPERSADRAGPDRHGRTQAEAVRMERRSPRVR
jgi:hypothetical protein